MSRDRLSRDPRLEMEDWSLKFRVSDGNKTANARVVDLSMSGVCIETDVPLEVGLPITIFVDSKNPQDTQAQVIWSKRVGVNSKIFRFGCEFFHNEPERLRDFLVELLSYLERKDLVEACVRIFQEGGDTARSLEGFIRLFRVISDTLNSGYDLHLGLVEALRNMAIDLNVSAYAYVRNPDCEDIAAFGPSEHWGFFDDDDEKRKNQIIDELKSIPESVSKKWAQDTTYAILSLDEFLDSSRRVTTTEIESVISFPITFDRQVMGTVCFFMKSEISNIRATGVILNNAGMELGQFLKRKVFEKQMRELENQLIRSSKLQTVSTLAGGIAHEINNPLSIIVGYISRLENLVQNEDFDKEAFQDIIARIRVSSSRIADNVKYLLSFSRDSSSNDTSTVISVNDLLSRLEKLVSPLRVNYGNSIHINSGAGNANLRCDSTQISQMLFHIVEYLVGKDADQNGVSRVRIDSSVRGQMLKVSIVLEGRALVLPESEDIFSPFGSSEGRSSAGLSLSVAKIIAEKHNGDLKFERGDGQTKFTLSLPLNHTKKKVA